MKCDTIPDLERFLKIQEQALGQSSAEVAITASKLAKLYLDGGRLDDAEVLFNRALKIQEKLVGVHHDDIEKTNEGLAKISLLRSPAKKQLNPPLPPTIDCNIKSLPEAEIQKQRTSGTRFGAFPESVNGGRPASISSKKVEDAIKETEVELDLLKQMVGADNPAVADLLTKLADLYCRLRMYSQMEPVLIDALKIREAACGSNHPSVSNELKNLARLYLVQERFALAEPLFKRALAIRERAYGRMHPRVADIEEQYAQLLRKTNRAYLAETLDQHVNAIRSQHLGDTNHKTSIFNGRW